MISSPTRLNLMRHLGVSLAVAGLLAAGSVAAQRPANPSTQVVQVTGRIHAGDPGKPYALSRAVLERLPQHSFSTNAPWTKKSHRYSGVLLRDLLAHLGASGSTVRATALNDYAISIPVEDARQFDVLVAYKVDGEPIPVRERGPMLVMYPFDAKPELQAKRYYERAIWQLRTLDLQ